MENNEEEFAAFEPYAILWDYLVNGKPEDMPDEVCVVLNWPYELMSLEMSDKFDDIRRRHPVYFPWETRYFEISKSVHDAYFDEMHPNGVFGGFLNTSPDGGAYDGSPGLVALIDEAGLMNSYSPKPFTLEDFDALAQRHLESAAAEAKLFQKAKALWDKHYSKFNLPYRP